MNTTNKPKSIAQEWAGFSKMVFGPNKPGDAQYAAMRQAFYGGAMVMFSNMTKVPDSMTSEDDGCKMMEDYAKEISNHVEETIMSLKPEDLVDALVRAAQRQKGGV